MDFEILQNIRHQQRENSWKHFGSQGRKESQEQASSAGGQSQSATQPQGGESVGSGPGKLGICPMVPDVGSSAHDIFQGVNSGGAPQMSQSFLNQEEGRAQPQEVLREAAACDQFQASSNGPSSYLSSND